MPNPIKALFKQDKIALGMNVRLARSGDIAAIAKTTGHDFIFIDGQHSLYNVETIGHIALAAIGVGIAPLARVSSKQGWARPLCPRVSTRSSRAWAKQRTFCPPLYLQIALIAQLISRLPNALATAR
jgi:hypothetical protein